MPAKCSMASCGWCGMCTAVWERDNGDDSDSDLFEYLVHISQAEHERIQQERADDEEPEEPPF